MARFGFGKSNQAEATDHRKQACCTPGETTGSGAPAPAGGERVQVLGSGCARCAALEAAAVEALAELGMDPSVGHVTDFTQIAAYGVMSTPALVVDGQVVSRGKVLKKEDVVKILKAVRE